MKISLVVMTAGKAAGQTIPITLSQFLIGRDPQCNLRPASALISKRHCAILVKNGKVFVRDFDSTNGTFINEQQIKGEMPLNNQDILKIGPLAFRVAIEVPTPVPVNKPTPPPKPVSQQTDDESVAAMLLSLQEDNDSPASPPTSGEIPGGSTIMEMVPLGDADKKDETKKDDGQKTELKSGDKKDEPKDTRSAAAAILEKYSRRQRS